MVALWLVVFALASLAQAQTQPHIETLAAWGGSIGAFQRVGTFGYCGIGQRFVALDLSNDANIHELGSVTLAAPVGAIAVRGNLAYVSAGYFTDYLDVVDISNASSPTVVWRDASAALNSGAAGIPDKIELYGNYLYMHGSFDVVVMYDISQPTSPAQVLPNGCFCPNVKPFVHLFDVGCCQTNDFDIVGSLMYVATASDGQSGHGCRVGVFDLEADAVHPTLIGMVEVSSIGEEARHIAVDGTTAIVYTRDSNQTYGSTYIVRFVDFSNPVNPVERGMYTDFFSGTHEAKYTVDIKGHLAFVLDSPLETLSPVNAWPTSHLKGLAILDITNPDAPVLVGTYNTDHSAFRGVHVVGDRAYLQCDGQGLVVLDISNPASPTRVGGLFSPGRMLRSYKAGNRLYVTDQWNGFEILDVSNPAAPQFLGMFQGPGGLDHQQHKNVQVAGNLAFLAAGYGGIQVVDVSNPAAPAMMLRVDGNGAGSGSAQAMYLEVEGNVLHVATSLSWKDADGFINSGLLNFAISTSPPALTQIGRASNVTGRTELVTKSGSGITFCVEGGGSSFYRCDNRDPTNPLRLLPAYIAGCDIEIVGNYLYGANHSSTTNGLYIFDVTDPLNPVQVGHTPTCNGCPIGTLPLGIGVSGTRAFVAGYFTLRVFDVTNPAAPQVIATSTEGGGTDVLTDGNIIYSTFFGDPPPITPGERPASGLLIRRFVEPPACGTADFDCDGDVGTDADIEAFFACLAGNCPAPPCPNGADFNNDGDIGTDADIESFFRVLGGGPC